VIEEPEFSEETYVVRKHKWTARWVADVSVLGAAATQLTGAQVTEDEETRGVPAAGLGADPLSVPPNGWFVQGVAELVGDRAAGAAGGELTRRAQIRRGECVGDAPVWTGAWLSCWAEATLWSGNIPTGLELMNGTAHAADRFRPSSLPAPVCVK
jgi:hypothetical protein